MSDSFNRRRFLKMLAAGGSVIAGEIWIPGERLISIPKPVTGFVDVIETPYRVAMIPATVLSDATMIRKAMIEPHIFVNPHLNTAPLADACVYVREILQERLDTMLTRAVLDGSNDLHTDDEIVESLLKPYAIDDS